jgi:glycosyltransferase involved in cell wall biosynthesis
MKATRIVVLLHELSLSGAPRLTLDILDGLTPGRSFRIIAREGGPMVAAARRLGPTAVLRQTGFVRLMPRRLATERVVQVLAGAGSRVRAFRQAAALRIWKPQLVYVSSVAALPLVPMLRLRGVPVVLHVHELGSALDWFDRQFPGAIRAIPERYVAVAHAVAIDLVDRMGVPPDAVSVVSPYVLTHHPGPSRTAGTAANAPVVIGGAGNPSWTKGIDLWLLAAREAVDRLGMDRLRFAWLGSRDNEAGLQFRTMIGKLGLESVVELVPETDRPYDQFARFDIFAMSSWEESASLVVLEAMAMRIPVICFSSTGGPAEEVGDAGVVIPEISPRLMADAIVDLVESPEKRRAMGLACAERVRRQFPREKSLAKLIRVFDAALA